MIRLSANLGFLWPDLPLLQRIKAAGRAGFKAIELHWPFDVRPDEVRASCAAADVELLALNTPVGDPVKGEFGLGALPGREADFGTAFQTALEYGAAAGAGAIHAMAGVAVADRPSRACFVDNLRRAARSAESHGFTVLIEPINHVDRPGYFLSGSDQAAEIISEVGMPNVKMLFDCYHLAIQGEDVMSQFEKHQPVIGHLQIAAVPSRAEPDEGRLDYRTVLDALDRAAYGGWVGCEYRPRGNTDAGLGWRAALCGTPGISW